MPEGLNVGAVNVSLGLDDAQYQKGMKEAQADSLKLGENIANSLKQVTSILNALATKVDQGNKLTMSSLKLTRAAYQQYGDTAKNVAKEVESASNSSTQNAINNNKKKIASDEMSLNQMRRMGREQSQIFSGIKMGIGGFVGFEVANMFRNAPKSILDTTIMLENATTSFRTLTGSISEAQKTTDDLTKYAVKTSFVFTDLAEETKKFLGVGFSEKGTMEALKMIGDLSMGNVDKLSRMDNAYTRIASTGRATQKELGMFTTAGVNVLGELAKIEGKSIGVIREEVTKGKIGFQEVNEALQNLTKSGGIFYNAMIAQSQTLGGLSSTLSDQWTMVGAKFGQLFLDDMKQATINMIEFGNSTYDAIEGFKKFNEANDVIGKLKLGLGEIAILMGSVWLGSVVGGMALAVKEAGSFNQALKVMIGLQNIAALTNPWALGTMALVGITAGLAYYISLQKTSNQLIKEATDASKLEASSVGSLSGAIKKLSEEKNKNAQTTQNLAEKTQQLIDLYPKNRNEIQKDISKYGELTDATLKQIAATITLAKTKDLVRKAEEAEKMALTQPSLAVSTPYGSYLPGSIALKKEALDLREEVKKINKQTFDEIKKSQSGGITGKGIGEFEDSAKASKAKKAGQDEIKRIVENFKEQQKQQLLAYKDQEQTLKNHLEAEQKVKQTYTEGSEGYEKRVKIEEDHLNKLMKIRTDNAKTMSKALEEIDLKGKGAKEQKAKIEIKTTFETTQAELIKAEEKRYKQEKINAQIELNKEIEKYNLDRNKTLAGQDYEFENAKKQNAIDEMQLILDYKIQNNELTKREEIKAQKEINDAKYNLEIAHIEAKKILLQNYIDSSKNNTILSDREIQATKDEIAQLDQQQKENALAQDIANHKYTMAMQQEKYAGLRRIGEAMKSDWQEQLSQIIQGNQTLAGSFQSVFATMRKSFADEISKMLMDWIKTNTLMTSIRQYFGLSTNASNASMQATNNALTQSNYALAQSNKAVASSNNQINNANIVTTQSTTLATGANKAASATMGILDKSLAPTKSKLQETADAMGKLAISSLGVALSFPIISLSSLTMALAMPLAAMGANMLAGAMTILTPVSLAFIPASALMTAGFSAIGAASAEASKGMAQLAISMAAASVAWIPIAGAVLAPMAALATAAAIGVGSKLATGSFSGGTTGQQGNAKAGQPAKLPGFADGGNPPINQPFIVGERGPEIMINRNPSTVIPNNVAFGNNNQQQQKTQPQQVTQVYSPIIQTGAKKEDIMLALKQSSQEFFGMINNGLQNNTAQFRTTVAGVR